MQELKVHLDDSTLEKLHRIGKALRGIHATLQGLQTLAEGLEAAETEGRDEAAARKAEARGEVQP